MFISVVLCYFHANLRLLLLFYYNILILFYSQHETKNKDFLDFKFHVENVIKLSSRNISHAQIENKIRTRRESSSSASTTCLHRILYIMRVCDIWKFMLIHLTLWSKHVLRTSKLVLYPHTHIWNFKNLNLSFSFSKIQAVFQQSVLNLKLIKVLT